MRWSVPCSRTLGRRLLAGLALCGYLVTVIGLPVAVHANPNRNTACRYQACGCPDTSTCGQTCCCCGHKLSTPAADEEPSPEPAGCPRCAQKPARPPAVAKTVVWVPGVQAAHCQGLKVVCLIMAGALPPPALEWRPETLTADAAPALLAPLVSSVRPPPIPPPRG